jgi:type I restriction enzyme S subunit
MGMSTDTITAPPTVPPGYKQTEVGVIPVEWQVASCNELCIKIQDGTHFSPKIGGGDYLYVTSRNIGIGKLDVSDADRISERAHRKIYARCDTRRGDLLLTKDGVNTGNAAINELDEECSLLSSVAFLRFDTSKHDQYFYLQYILSHNGQQQIKAMMSGNAITRLTLQKIQRLQMPVPPPPEQRAIAAALADVDGLITVLDRLIAKKRAIKQATMQQLLTGKTRLPGFGGEWETKRLEEIADINIGRTPSRNNSSFWGSGYKWISIADLKSKWIYSTAEEITALAASRMTAIPADTLIMSFKLSIGRLAFTGLEMYSNEAICSLQNLDGVAEYFYYALGRVDFSLYGKQAVKGYTLNKDSLREVEILYPSHEEQAAIAAVLSDMDAEIAALEQRRDKTQAIKQGMMQQLLTGRIRLTTEEGDV